ncbi:unnamed protein product [Acanthoscelides obtectus]|nr:unnamed protein product [Acanthoscelides obtectus]CAK1639801.1 Chromatin accessibility complex protein 1 [Acanthoscelides obtectus]
MTSAKGHLPVSRINTIMKSSCDVDTVGKDSSIMMCKATEIFIKTLAQEAFRQSHANNKKRLDYKHLTDVVHSDTKYNFLKDILPKKITYAKYKEIMAKKNKQMAAEQNDDGRSSPSSSSSCSSSSEEDSSSESNDAGSHSA